MNHSLKKVITLKCKPLMALIILLFFWYDVSWANTPLRTRAPEKNRSVKPDERVNTSASQNTGVISAADVQPADCTLPGAFITSSGNLSCSRTSTTLAGSAEASSVTYSWSGPGGYSSMLQSVVVSLPGTYTLTVTNTNGGCTSTTTTEVTQDIALPGATASVSHALDCAHPSVTLQASTPLAGATFRWIGNNFVSTAQNPTITAPGGYTLNVTNPVNGCTSTATVNVTQSINTPGVTPSVSGMLTCVTTQVELGASSPTAGAIFSWTGPSGFTSDTQYPMISAPGSYTVRATNPLNSCFSTSTINVTQNITAPGANITSSGQITCTNGSVTLSGSSPTLDVTYQWSGPGAFNSVVQNPVATAPGTYVLTTTRASNGCTSVADYTVILNNTRPGAIASSSGQLNCTVSSITLQGSSPTADVTYRWIGPTNSGFTSMEQSPVTSIRGGYTLTVTNPANGCTSTTATSVIQNITAPANVAIAPPAFLTCAAQSVTLAGSSTTSGATYSWSGPGTITNPLTATPSVTSPGMYTLLVTNPVNNCTATATVNVVQDVAPPANVVIAPPAILTCTTLDVALAASSSTPGVTYAWTGPGTIANPAAASISVSQPGAYNLIVTNTANGCTAPASVTVEQNITAPGVTPSASGIFTCNVSSITLTANSSTPGLTYQWSGPEAFTSTLFNPIVTASGSYNVIVTNPVNGCTSTSSITTQEDKTVPGVTSSVAGVLTCTQSAAFLEANSPTAGVLYSWTGPDNYSSTEQYPTTTVPGLYTVTATNPLTGCTSTHSVTVNQDTTPPANVLASASGDLTCAETSVTLFGESTTAGVTYRWSGPGSYTSTEQNPEALLPGLYILTVTNPANGCTEVASVSVEENTTAPEGVTATASADLSCVTNTVTLTGTSTTPGVSYSWTGPNGFTAGVATPSVTQAGMYALTVTNAVNGCESSATVSVSQDITAPVVTSHVSGMLTCSVTQVTLNAVSPAAGLLYSWSGPGSFVSNQQNPVTATPGVYTVTATNPVNGCTSTSTVTVEQNLQLPENVAASYTGTGIITCSTPSVTLTGSSTTSGVTYNWSGPGTISNPTSATVSVTTPGLYTVTVTNPLNNCTVSEGVTVNQNTIAPQNVTITPPAPLTCTRLSTTLQASSSTSGVTYQWTGTGAITNPTSSTASVSTAGTYNLVVTNPVNGCTTTPPAVIVSSNTTLPTVSISTPDGVALSCFVNPVRLNGSSTTPGVTYQWTNTEGLSVAQQNLLATVPSDYTLTVTDPVNGCQRSTTRRITQTLTNPTATASVSGVINCLAPSVNLLGSSSGSPVTYSWSGPSGFTSAAQNPPVSIPGTYVLTITTPGGCTATASTNVQQNSTLPANVTYEVSGPLDDCGSDIVVLSANSTTPGAFYSWTGPDDFESTEQDAVTTAAGVYTLVVTHPLSGCSETREVTVLFEPCPETLFSRSATNGKLAVQNNAEEVMTWGDGLFTVGVYPNPTRGKASIEFIPDGNYRVMVEVYSPLNVKVATYNPGEVTAGRTYTVVFDPENHTSGVYLYRIHYGPGRTLEGRFIVTR